MISEPFLDLKKSIRAFLRVYPAQSADPASAGTKVVQRVKGAIVPSILQNPPPQESIQEDPVPVSPAPEPPGPIPSKKKKTPKLHKCPQCNVTKTNDLKDHK